MWDRVGQNGCGQGAGQFGEGEGRGTRASQRAAWPGTKHEGALKSTTTPGPFHKITCQHNKSDKTAKPMATKPKYRSSARSTSFGIDNRTALLLPDGVGGAILHSYLAADRFPAGPQGSAFTPKSHLEALPSPPGLNALGQRLAFAWVGGRLRGRERVETQAGHPGISHLPYLILSWWRGLSTTCSWRCRARSAERPESLETTWTSPPAPWP